MTPSAFLCRSLTLLFIVCTPSISASTEITLGGELKFDAYHDTATSGNKGPRGYDLLSFREVPLDGTNGAETPGGTKFHGRGSKLFIASQTDSPLGKIKTYVEGDFLGRVDSGEGTDDDVVSNSYEFRLRQAYMTWGNWLVGQTWSNFVDLKAYPEGLTFSSLLGRGFGRQAQIRYSHDLGKGDKFALSFENPNTDFNYGTPAPGANNDEADRFPDLVATYFNRVNQHHIRLSILVRDLGVDTSGTSNDVALAQDDREVGWGLGVSGKYAISERLNLKLNLNGGDGIGRYLFSNQFRAAVFVDGELKTESAWGGNIMAQYRPSEALRLNIGYGMHTVGISPYYVAGSVTKTLTSLHLNGIWTLAKELEVGVGLTHATRVVKSGEKGDIARVMLTVKRKFAASF